MNSVTTGGGLVAKIKSKMTPMNIMIALFVVILIGVSVYYYYYYMNSNKNEYGDNSIQVTNAGGIESGEEGDAEIMFFHADWCPHCKKAKPEWEKVRSAYEDKGINGYNVQCTEVNCTDETPEVQAMVEKYNIEGYPTIKLIKGDQLIDFEAKPTETTITQFLKTVL